MALIACPQCRKQLQLSDAAADQEVQCPECKHIFSAGARQPEPPEDAFRDRPRSPRYAEDDDYAERRPYDDDDVRRRYREPHRGTMILIFGILGLVVCGIFAPIAWVMGNADMAKIRGGDMDPSGEGATQAGRILGIIGTVILAIQVVLIVFYLVFFAIFISHFG